MFVFVDRGQRKNLWIDGGFEIEDKPDGFRVQLAYADLLDIRIVRLDFRDQFFQSRIQFGSVYIDDKPVRVGEQEMFCMDIAVVFQRDACIVISRPGPHRDNVACHDWQGSRQQHGDECNQGKN